MHDMTVQTRAKQTKEIEHYKYIFHGREFRISPQISGGSLGKDKWGWGCVGSFTLTLYLTSKILL